MVQQLRYKVVFREEKSGICHIYGGLLKVCLGSIFILLTLEITAYNYFNFGRLIKYFQEK